MIYSFITEKDLDVAMKEYFRDQITDDKEKLHIQTLSEGAAFSLIKSKLNSRYDLTLLFPKIQNWTDSLLFLTGSYCCREDKVYLCQVSTSTGNDPLSNITAWKESDPRDKLLIVYCAVMTVYNMSRSINPRKISNDLENAYAGILEWLDDVNAGLEHPDWPILSEGSNTIQWGSEPQREHYY
jgi:hypothetical protein